MKKIIAVAALCLAAAGLCFSQSADSAAARRTEPENLDIFRRAYPDVEFTAAYDAEREDWRLTLAVPDGDSKRTETLYWSGGAMLPESELDGKTRYGSLIYNYKYGEPPEDPANFTQEQINRTKNFSSTENRRSSSGTPMFFYDAIYDSSTKASLEQHIKKVSFLGKSINVHERLEEPLKRVERRIKDVSRISDAVAQFIAEIGQMDAYYWRLIAGTNRKSFHSLGVSVDILPKNLRGKAIFWSWTKDINPNWMLTPLADRWMPPEPVINIFEDEGFIWGGKWGIWDNMHFEYRPELIVAAKQRKGLR